MNVLRGWCKGLSDFEVKSPHSCFLVMNLILCSRFRSSVTHLIVGVLIVDVKQSAVSR